MGSFAPCSPKTERGAASQRSQTTETFYFIFFPSGKKLGQSHVCFPSGEPDGWRGGSWMNRLPDRQLGPARRAAAGGAGGTGTSLPGARGARLRRWLGLCSQCGLITVSIAIRGKNPTKAAVCKHQSLPGAPAQAGRRAHARDRAGDGVAPCHRVPTL